MCVYVSIILANQYTWSYKTNTRNTLHNSNSHTYKMILWFSKPEIHNRQISNKNIHSKEAYRMVNSRVTHLER